MLLTFDEEGNAFYEVVADVSTEMLMRMLKAKNNSDMASMIRQAAVIAEAYIKAEEIHEKHMFRHRLSSAIDSIMDLK